MTFASVEIRHRSFVHLPISCLDISTPHLLIFRRQFFNNVQRLLK